MAPEQAPKIKHWEVISHEGTDHAYSWRCIGLGDVIIDSSQPFNTYGAALADAIRHGFNPEIHHWVNVDRHFTFHFGPGKTKPVIVPHESKPYTGPLRRKTDRPAGDKSRNGNLGEKQ